MDLLASIEEGIARKIEPQNFECHITLAPEHNTPFVQSLAKFHKFKTSLLVGDEELGDAKHLYITSHDYTYQRMELRMDDLVYSLSVACIPIRRKKIEHILLDERY